MLNYGVQTGGALSATEAFRRWETFIALGTTEEVHGRHSLSTRALGKLGQKVPGFRNWLMIVTRWKAFRGAFGAFITVPSLQRDLAALLVEQSLASIGSVQPPPPASTRERYLGHLTSLKTQCAIF
jgi:hypothetical protein